MKYQEGSKSGNMNGRMYDPVVKRFLSTDPVIQDMNNPENFNRYSYCLNNPLAYVDPSGYRSHPSSIEVADLDHPDVMYNTNVDSNADYWDEWEAGLDQLHRKNKEKNNGGSEPITFTYSFNNKDGSTFTVGGSSSGDVYLNGEPSTIEEIAKYFKEQGIETIIVENEEVEFVNEDGMIVKAAISYLAVLQTDILTPEPTDGAWPKWVAHGILTGATAIILYSEGKSIADYMSKGGHRNVWPDRYPKPNPANIDWSLSDSDLATGVTGGGVPTGPGSEWSKIKKWFRDTRKKIKGKL